MPVTAVRYLYSGFQNPWNAFKHIGVSTFKDSFWVGHRLALGEIFPGWQCNKLDKKERPAPNLLQEKPKWVTEGRESRGQYSFYHLDLSMTAVKLVKEGCPERGQL